MMVYESIAFETENLKKKKSSKALHLRSFQESKSKKLEESKEGTETVNDF